MAFGLDVRSLTMQTNWKYIFFRAASQCVGPLKHLFKKVGTKDTQVLIYHKYDLKFSQ